MIRFAQAVPAAYVPLEHVAKYRVYEEAPAVVVNGRVALERVGKRAIKRSGRGLAPASCSGISLFCLFSDLTQGSGGGIADTLVIVF